MAKRIERELQELLKDPNIATAAPVGENIFHWHVAFLGPDDSPYAGGVFFLEIHFPANYPFTAPRVTFTTKIYHSHIRGGGALFCDCDHGNILCPANWSPALSVRTVYHLSISV